MMKLSEKYLQLWLLHEGTHLIRYLCYGFANLALKENLIAMACKRKKRKMSLTLSFSYFAHGEFFFLHLVEQVVVQWNVRERGK